MYHQYLKILILIPYNYMYIISDITAQPRIFWSCRVISRLREELMRMKTTVMILSFRTDRPGQTVQTQIRLLLESDQGLHCLPFRLHHLDSYSMVEPHSSNFRVITINILGVRIFRKFTVIKKYYHPTMHHVYLLGAASTAELFTTMTINKVRRMPQS